MLEKAFIGKKKGKKGEVFKNGQVVSG